MVQVALTDVDRGKVDHPTLTCVVVEEVPLGLGDEKVAYRVACLAGVLVDLYHPAYLQAVPNVTALAMGLEHVVQSWKGLPIVTVRAATRSQSATGSGGQGMLHCLCKGDCTSGKCSCLKAGRKCSSRCHKNNSKCKNKGCV